jgi:hypothetical protein
LRCSDCGLELLPTGVDRAFVCPLHGHPLATVEGHMLWKGEIVRVIEPTRHNAGRFVIHFEGGKQRTIRSEHLRVFAMDHVLPGQDEP